MDTHAPTESALADIDVWERNGAVEKNDIEPTSVFSILQELEEWDKHLKALPEVTHKLRAFAQASRGTIDDSAKTSPVEISPRRSGPSRKGPSL